MPLVTTARRYPEPASRVSQTAATDAARLLSALVLATLLPSLALAQPGAPASPGVAAGSAGSPSSSSPAGSSGSASASRPATEPPAPGPDGPPMGPPRLSLGLGVLASDSPYAGVGLKVRALPLIQYRGERFFIQGRTIGWRLFGSEGDGGPGGEDGPGNGPVFDIAAVVALRLDGFKPKDLGGPELAANGIDRNLLKKRRDAADVGLAANWESPVGDLSLEVLVDASGASRGQEVGLKVEWPFFWAGMRISPGVGLTWQSRKMADYYFGTLDAEEARGIARYRPGAGTIPSIGISLTRPFAGRWALFGLAVHERLPGRFERSPLIEAGRNGRTTVLLGISRGF